MTQRTALSGQVTVCWNSATAVSLSSATIRRRLLLSVLRTRNPLYGIPLTQNHRRLRLQLDRRVDMNTGVPIGNKSSF